MKRVRERERAPMEEVERAQLCQNLKRTVRDHSHHCAPLPRSALVCVLYGHGKLKGCHTAQRGELQINVTAGLSDTKGVNLKSISLCERRAKEGNSAHWSVVPPEESREAK